MYTVQLQVRAEHFAGPEPEWSLAAEAIAQAIRDLDTLHFNVPGGQGAALGTFGGCVLAIHQVEIDTAEEEGDDGRDTADA